MGLHHKTLEAAIKNYGPLVKEGKTEAEVKAAIAADEKAFDEDAIKEIYAALNLVEPDADKEGEGKEYKHIVKSYFRDVNNFSIEYNEGDDVSHFVPERLEYAIKMGLVEKVVNDK